VLLILHIKNYGYSVKGLYYLSIDNDRFINHSEIPNVRETADPTYAIRDIEENEELLTDYRTLNMLDWHSSIK
jgi:SET domain-containing protein